MAYNWQQKDWPEFRYTLNDIEDALFAFAEETGHLSGILKGMPEKVQTETMIDIMVSEAIKTSEIEGEYLSRPDVISSIRNNLGLNINQEKIKDKKAEGAGKLMVVVRNTFSSPLTERDLFSWHRMLMNQNPQIKVGVWRTHKEPMQVVSGAMGKEKIHFEAPPSSSVPGEMRKFINWFNDTAPGGKKEIKKSPVRSAIAHLYFETIHPFEDGNGRIGRAIAEKALSQTTGRPVFLSLSQTIGGNRKSYYAALEKAQNSNEITAWINYFVNTLLEAQRQTKIFIDLTLRKTKFFDRFKNQLNERQLKAVKRMIDAEPKGFEGGMTAKKYSSLAKVSKATATRDLQELTDLKILLIRRGGRSTNYSINLSAS
ncbi:MAG: Fic family protein [Bacteroidia bacterium]